MISFLRNFLESFSYLIYSAVLFFVWRATKSNTKKILFLYYVIAVFVISYACVIAYDPKDNNNWLYNIHYFLSAVVFGYYFKSIISGYKRKLVIKISCLITLVVLVATIYFSHPDFNSAGNAFFFLFVTFCTFVYYNQTFSSITEENILRDFDFWLVSGYLIYFLGSFFIIVTYKYLTDNFSEEQTVILGDLWSIQNILLLISSGIALFGYLCTAYQKKSR